MKILASLLLLLTVGFAARADDKKGTEWPALKAFHSVMAQTFHPSEEGNLEPIRTRAGELVQKADALSQGTIPAQYNTPKMQDAIKRLQAGTKDVQTMVAQKASDTELKIRLSALHDTFHEIMGLCRKGDGHEGDEHSHEGHSH